MFFFLKSYNKFVSTAHANEWIVCCVSNDWGITEMVPSMCTCPISGRLERWHLRLYNKLNTTNSGHRTMILSYISSVLYLFIGVYSTWMQASDTCYCTVQMTMYRENTLLDRLIYLCCFGDFNGIFFYWRVYIPLQPLWMSTFCFPFAELSYNYCECGCELVLLISL